MKENFMGNRINNKGKFVFRFFKQYVKYSKPHVLNSQYLTSRQIFIIMFLEKFDGRGLAKVLNACCCLLLIPRDFYEILW